MSCTRLVDYLAARWLHGMAILWQWHAVWLAVCATALFRAREHVPSYVGKHDVFWLGGEQPPEEVSVQKLQVDNKVM